MLWQGTQLLTVAVVQVEEVVLVVEWIMIVVFHQDQEEDTEAVEVVALTGFRCVMTVHIGEYSALSVSCHVPVTDSV